METSKCRIKQNFEHKKIGKRILSCTFLYEAIEAANKC